MRGFKYSIGEKCGIPQKNSLQIDKGGESEMQISRGILIQKHLRKYFTCLKT